MAYIVDKYGANIMTTPLICVVKGILDLPMICMMFLQQSMFYLTIGGIVGEYFLARGWTSLTVYMLQTVVDPSIKGITVAMYLWFKTIVGAIAPLAFEKLYSYYDASPVDNKQGFGNLMSVMTIIPCAISIPLFYVGGLKYKDIKIEIEKTKSQTIIEPLLESEKPKSLK